MAILRGPRRCAQLLDFVIAEHARVMLLPRMSRYAMLMRLDRRLLLTSLAAVAATSLIAPNAHACMCTDWTQEERIVQADLIFRGRVISRQ